MKQRRQVTSAHTPTHAPTAPPAPAETPLAIWESHTATNWALWGIAEAELSRENAPDMMPDSIVEMIPLVEAALSHRYLGSFRPEGLDILLFHVVLHKAEKPNALGLILNTD